MGQNDGLGWQPGWGYNEEEIIFDYMGEVEGMEVEITGPDTDEGRRLNIDDPDYDYNKWANEVGLYIKLAIDNDIKSCHNDCRKKDKERERRCSFVRKRVAISLRKIGCPSKVIPIKTKRKCMK